MNYSPMDCASPGDGNGRNYASRVRGWNPRTRQYHTEQPILPNVVTAVGSSPFSRADSTLNRNTVVEGLTEDLVRFPWSAVDATLYLGDLRIADVGEVGAFRSVMANESVRVLVAAVLPGTVGFGEVKIGLTDDADRLVVGELLTIARGDGVDRLANVLLRATHGLGIVRTGSGDLRA